MRSWSSARWRQAAQADARIGAATDDDAVRRMTMPDRLPRTRSAKVAWPHSAGSRGSGAGTRQTGSGTASVGAGLTPWR